MARSRNDGTPRKRSGLVLAPGVRNHCHPMRNQDGMKRWIVGAGLSVAGAILTGAGTAPQLTAVAILSFEREGEPATVETSLARAARTPGPAEQGGSVLRVECEPGGYPTVRLKFSSPQDWRRAFAVALDVTNHDQEDLVLHLRIDDHPAANDEMHSRSAWSVIPAGETRAVAFPLSVPSALSLGMREPARVASISFANLFGPGRADLGHVVALSLYLKEPKKPRRYSIDRVRLLEGDAADLLYRGVVDRFGQFTREEWPGKVSSDEMLKQQAQDERERLKAGSEAALDDFAGWKGGPEEEATGYFRTERRDGRWWLVTPVGSLFFSLGVGVIQTEAVATYIEGREHLFETLPSLDGPLARHFGEGNNAGDNPVGQARAFARGRWFNFYTANLERKYGPDWKGVWPQVTLDRLRAWGFNTVANWSDAAVTQAKDSRGRRLPYVYSLWYGGEFARVGTAADWWGPMPDPFDPRFAQVVEQWLEPKLQERSSDPYLLGYFVDNELSWAMGRNSKKDRERFSLVYGVLQQRHKSPAKAAWCAALKERYTIGQLNDAWKTQFSSWENWLDEPFFPPEEIPEPMRSDFSAFSQAYAEKYFGTLADIIRRHDPNHLYLGARFSSFAKEHVQGCAAHCDVVSFNLYAPDLEGAGDWSFLEKVKKPVIVGEFHFGATDRGLFGAALIPVGSQEERGKGYARYLHSLARHPSFVGAHWFQYIDQPLTGRLFDGENYNVGFVSVADTPYPELTRAATAANSEVYRLRLGGEKEVERDLRAR